MPETPNHGYNVPSEGEKDWHEPLNENFEQYDTDIEVRDKGANAGNYTPKAGAKFFATDTGRVFLGDGSTWNSVPTTGPVPSYAMVNPDGKNLGIGSSRRDVPLDVAGRNNWDLNNSDGDVRIGDADNRLALGVALGGGGAGTVNIRAKGESKRLNLGAGSTNSVIEIGEFAATVHEALNITKQGEGINFTGEGDDVRIWSSNFSGLGETLGLSVGNGKTVHMYDGKMRIFGDLSVDGNKNFTQSVDTDDGEKEVVYTATEAGTPHTEASGVVELEDGRATVDLPDHFSWVTDDDEPLMVQVTPHASEPVRPQVTDRSTDRIVVEDFGDGPGSYEVSYTVKGTRDGQADKEVVREPSPEETAAEAPSPADD